MVMSILHRLTGAALYFGTLLLAAWLIAAAMGEAQFDFVNALFAHPIGKLDPVRLHLGARPSHAGRHAASDLGHRQGLSDLAGQRAVLADDHRLRSP